MNISEYRQLILDDLLTRKTEKGEPMIEASVAKSWLDELSDEELAEGMLFNEPKDVADIIIETR